MIKKSIFIGFIIFSQCIFSQNSGENKLGAWYMYFGTHKLNKNLSLHTEAQLRMYEPTSNFFQLLPRIGLNYHLNSYSSITAGYALIPTSSYDKTDEFKTTALESRIWQQFILKNFVGRVRFMHRYRVEQRWIETKLPSEKTINKYLNRLRYFFKITAPLNNEEIKDKTAFIAIYNEVFLNLIEQPFDQNRLYLALGYKLNSNLKIEAGYQSRWTNSARYNILQLAAFVSTGNKK